MWRALTQRNAVDRTLAEHRAILDALERGDAELAQALTTVHISGVEQWLHDGVRLAARGVHLGAGTG
jgi:GntR family transcriptional repressor for pyruvate dehydrogenase complex